MVEAMVVVSFVRWMEVKVGFSAPARCQRALRLQHHRAVDHAAVELRRAGRGGLGGQHAPRPVEGVGARAPARAWIGATWLRMDAQLGAEAVAARQRQVGQQPRLVVELRRDAGHRRGEAGQRARRARCGWRRRPGRSASSAMSRSRSSAKSSVPKTRRDTPGGRGDGVDAARRRARFRSARARRRRGSAGAHAADLLGRLGLRQHQLRRRRLLAQRRRSSANQRRRRRR